MAQGCGLSRGELCLLPARIDLQLTRTDFSLAARRALVPATSRPGFGHRGLLVAHAALP